MKTCFLVVICLVGIYRTRVQGRLEPTKLEDKGLYRLEIQSEDKFLTSSNENIAARARWANKLEQKWQFNQAEGGWKLKPLGGREISVLWKISYVGHGKYRFMNEASGLCLAGVGSSVVTERPCEKDSPYQRWLVVPTKP